MRTPIALTVCLLSIAACTPTENYKDVRKEVVEEHDQVMIDSERALENRLKLDSLLSKLDSIHKANPQIDTIKEKETILSLKQHINQADQTMETWMKEFDAELGTKSNEQAVAYFKQEKHKLKKMDSLFNKVLAESGEYLRTHRH